jgi:hypothetical protein
MHNPRSKREGKIGTAGRVRFGGVYEIVGHECMIMMTFLEIVRSSFCSLPLCSSILPSLSIIHSMWQLKWPQTLKLRSRDVQEDSIITQDSNVTLKWQH